ncbi:tRNA (adenosine(37)-N6)-threonylcarbamoyltransferase complex ATPase subunit type 1 TsaE [Candidatus Palibaumannia cicadellinicola]|uniref:tRNA threonylcarbamoyladenosine biosynthesis protein TsaE n=1 Tax=Candidatus Palibaumannia cicadellinicola TaxID=186490 RepID=A0A2N4XWC5_9GAMM|nr:tRNA (adenosine(37)-N6)-threonylcarbamoyltransferase complex ATPase subunit type 1 TsaE [Candidatus Baumannia cicadellinicola]PLK58331.1 tRNA (adenosine(37)-N6)-threonylcarbamoyltransferase complex ATPase subunit type 1 TsaE [Candidatus Baumannia cicadellinicola]
MEKRVILLPDETATVALGAALAVACQQACVIYLYGNIGAGKTTLCRGFLRSLGYAGNVKSPTYTLVELYALTRWTVYHFDLYRLAHTNTEELELISILDYLDHSSLCLIEWPQYGKGILPIMDLSLTLEYQGTIRRAKAEAFNANGKRLLAALSLQQEPYS